MLARLTMVVLSIISLAPTVTNASECTDFVKQVRNDIKTIPQAQIAARITLPLLQKTLGDATPLITAEGLSTYKWICPEDENISLSAQTATDGSLIKISGVYSDNDGAELFSAKLSDNPIQPKIVQKSLSCEDIFNRIISDHPKYLEAAQKSQLNFSWMNLGFLKQYLGTPDESVVTYTLAKWNGYSLYTGDGEVEAKGGNIPGISADSSFEDISDLLGQPTFASSEMLNKYHWQCPDVGELSATTDKQGKLINLKVNGLAQIDYSNLYTTPLRAML